MGFGLVNFDNIPIKSLDLEKMTGNEIKDSGNRREFETGAVRDIQTGKGRMDLMPMTAIIGLSKHCEAGALKYGERNIDKGIPQHSLIDSALRHIAKYTRGDNDENHLLAALWNIAWAVEQDVNRPELNDLPWAVMDNDSKQGKQDSGQ